MCFETSGTLVSEEFPNLGLKKGGLYNEKSDRQKRGKPTSPIVRWRVIKKAIELKIIKVSNTKIHKN